MRHATLFSGIGGPEIAAERLGWESVFTCEWEDFPRKVLEYHYPNADHYGDITTFDARKYRGQINVLTGGFPCQPFSVAGSQKGATDDRYLWPEMLRVISECQPTWVIGENVSGIIPMAIQGAPFEVGSQGNLFEEGSTIYERTDEGILEGICQDLEREGYEVWPVVIPAEAVGAPHRRDRIFIVGYSDEIRRERLSRTKKNDSRGLQEGVEEGHDAQQSNGARNASNTKQNGRRAGRSDGARQNQDTSIGSNVQFESERPSEVESTSDTDEVRCNDGSDNREGGQLSHNQDGDASESQQKWSGRIGGACETGSNADATNASKPKLEGGIKQRGVGEEGEVKRESGQLSGSVRSEWENFPTQSPICDRNDEFSSELDGITFSKWRRESIKAYGNAIVPEVIFRIYQGIDEIENQRS